MTSKERAQWRAKANSLEPVVHLGKDGISDNLISQADDTLDARELIKIRVHLETAPQSPRHLAVSLAEALQAEIIQIIGGIIVLYRKADKKKIALKRMERGCAVKKKTVKKKVKIKGMRQRNREKEAENHYAAYNRNDGRGRR